MKGTNVYLNVDEEDKNEIVKRVLEELKSKLAGISWKN